MSVYESITELANKVDWEGGLEEFLFGYGCSPDDMPTDELYQLVEDIYKAYPSSEIERMQEILDGASE